MPELSGENEPVEGTEDKDPTYREDVHLEPGSYALLYHAGGDHQLAIGKAHDALRSRRLDDEPDFIARFQTSQRLKRSHVADAAQEIWPERLRPIRRHGGAGRRPAGRGRLTRLAHTRPTTPSWASRPTVAVSRPSSSSST